MKRKYLICLCLLTFFLAGCGRGPDNNPENGYLPPPKKVVGSENNTININTSFNPTIIMERTLPNHEDLAREYTQAVIKTSFGEIKLGFYAEESPITVNNFLNLAKQGFYDGTLFHRVIDDFMIQGGDPNSRSGDWSTHGTGGPGYKFKDEINNRKLVRGSLAMANSGADTNGSQFFIVTKESTPWLDGGHTNFGYVVEGMEVVENIEKTTVDEAAHPLEDLAIESIELIK